jgi:phosphate:Na+ symporter
VRHLYDNAFDYMATGLGLSADAIRSEKPLAAVVATPLPVEAPDLDDLYERRIKSIHGAIVAFALKAEAGMLAEQVEKLQRLRIVSRDLVNAIKDVKHLNKNLRRFSTSSNADIAGQYKDAKSLIAKLMRALEQLRQGRPPSRAEWQALQAEVKASDVVASGELDHLIRENRITPDMATSMMNDNRYVQDICDRLINAALLVLENRQQPSDPEMAAA